MTQIFVKLINMSISASWVVLAVLLLRFLLKKAPKWINVTLWGIVGIRLICPFSLESALSLIPSAETISPDIMFEQTPHINTGIPVLNSTLNPVISGSFSPEPTTSANPLQLILPTLALIWVMGVFAMLLYTFISYWRIKKKVKTAVILRDNIFHSENVSSPFVFGIIKPKIYLPFNIFPSDSEHVIAHEKAHICRKDHLWKPIGFLLLSLHWFNPLMWFGYILLCRDIELACDEKVIKKLNIEQKADYSQALLTCSVNRKVIAACPLAFGEVGVKNRVKSVLNYKKPAFWIIVCSILICIIVAICFLTNPTFTNSKELNYFIEQQLIEEHYGAYKKGQYCCTDFKILGSKKNGNDTTFYMWVLYQEYTKENGKIEDVSGAHLPTALTIRKENGEYKLIEHWVPRDGAYYAGDIRSKFPIYLWLTDGTKYIDKQKDKCLKKAEKYFSSISSVGGYEPPEKIITSNYLETLEEKYPMYFNLPTSNGLEVYLWQMGESIIHCGLLPKENRNYTVFELWETLHKSPASLEEMRMIVASYLPSITKNDVVVIPVQMPHSSFAYVIDEEYTKKITNLFWSDFPVLATTSYIPSIDTATFDIDSDGINEACSLTYGPTSGLSTYILTVYGIGEIKYFNIFHSPYTLQRFEKNKDGKTMLIGKDGSKTILINISTKDGNIVLSNGEKTVPYWGEQGINSPYAPKAVNKLNKAIASVLTQKYGKQTYGKHVNIQSFSILASSNDTQNPSLLTVYMIVYNMKYNIGEYVEEVEGKFFPAMITFSFDENEDYTLKDYWAAKGEGEQEDEVRARFPSSVADEALNIEKYALGLTIDSWRQANDYMMKK